MLTTTNKQAQAQFISSHAALNLIGTPDDVVLLLQALRLALQLALCQACVARA